MFESIISTVVNKIVDAGLNQIRCTLTGQPIGTLSLGALQRAVAYEVFESPLSDDETLFDTFETRWLIQSKPAPHLTANNGPRAYEFLLANHPKDLLAMLAGKMIFENLTAIRMHGTKTLQMSKAQWLKELWDHDSMAEWTDAHQVTLNTLIRLDAIHSIRDCMFSNDVKAVAEEIRENEFSFESLAIFVSVVEDAAFLALTRMAQNKARGNPLALRAAILQSGLTPEQLVAEEEKAIREAEEKRRHYQSLGATMSGKSGTVKVNRGLKPTLSLNELGATLPAALRAKYAAELKGKESSAKPAADKVKKPSKSAARFGSLDFSVDFSMGESPKPAAKGNAFDRFNSEEVSH